MGGACKPVCWIVAAVAGALVGAVVANGVAAIVIGVGVFAIGGFALTKLVCSDATSAERAASTEAPRVEPAAPAPKTAPAETAVETEAAPTPKPKPARAKASAAKSPDAAAGLAAARTIAMAVSPDAAGKPSKSGAHWSATVRANSGRASAGRGQSELKPTATLTEEDTLRDGVGVWRWDGVGGRDLSRPTD